MNTPDSTKAFLEFWAQAKGTLPDAIAEADLNTLNSGLYFLFADLRHALSQFERGFKQGGDNGREGAFIALGAFWRLITLFRTPLSEGLQVPILRLQDALAGLEQNRVEPILTPVPRDGRAPSGAAYLSLKGYATATVERLVQIGLTRQQADDAVAKQLRKLNIRPERGPGSITSTTVRNWRDEVSSDVSRQGVAALMHDYKWAHEEKVLALPKPQASKFVLQALADWALSIFPELQNLANPPS